VSADELRAKSVAGAVAGAILGILSVLLGPPSELLSYILIVLYLLAYPASLLILRITGRSLGLNKGVSVFYSIEFILWAGVYELLTYVMMR
jgi:hypothetical protein